MDKVADYVLGKEDGIPKTPEWAAPKCGVPEWTIKALAREFASHVTSICHYFGGGLIRGPYSHEPARLEVIMLGMQGLGKPGVHQAQVAREGMPRDSAPQAARSTMDMGLVSFWGKRAWNSDTDEEIFKAHADRIRRPHSHTMKPLTKSLIPKTLIQEAILNPPVTFMGNGRYRYEY